MWVQKHMQVQTWARGCLTPVILGALLCAAGPVQSQVVPREPLAAVQPVHLQSGPLEDTLNRVSQQFGVTLSFDPALTRGRTSPALLGDYDIDDVLARLLAEHGLQALRDTDGAYTLRRLPGGVVSLPTIPVTARANESNASNTAVGQTSRSARFGALGTRDLADVPFSVTSYTRQTVQNRQAQTLGDVIRADPASQTALGHGNFSEEFIVRGFPLSASDVTFGGMYGVLPRQIIPANIIERVDVLKGANTFLNGIAPTGSGIGGALNIEPKRAGDKPLTEVTLDYTSGQVGGSIDLGRRFGDDAALGLRISSARRSGSTAIDDEHRQLKFDAIALDYRGEGWRTSLDLGRQRQTINGGRSVVYLSDAGVPPPPSTTINYGQDWNLSRLSTRFGMLRGEVDLAPDWQAYAGVGGSRTNEFGTYSSPTVNANGVGIAGRLTVPYRAENASFETGLRGRVQTGAIAHRLTLSASLSDIQTRAAYSRALPGFPTSLYDPPDVPYPVTTEIGGNLQDPGLTRRSRLRSIAASDTLSWLDDRIQLSLGARYQQIKAQTFNYRGINTSAYDRAALTPMLGIVVKPWQYLSVYANRTEGLAQGGQAPAAATNAGETFAPFMSSQYELGIKLEAAGLFWTASLFAIRQPNAYVDATSLRYLPAGEQRNRGAEITVAGEVLPGLRIVGGASFIDARLTRTGDRNTQGRHAIGVPSSQLSLGGEWDLPATWVGIDGLTAQGQIIRSGPQFANANNTQRLPAWTRMDLGLRYATRIRGHDVTWRANLENVTDRRYWASANGGYLTQGTPRTVKLAVTIDY
ncbi:TonB-dependent receptor [Pigmentiphaga aceris]|uniref:TonB-dependent receptor n=1 Tax=Pigmentiphaga aceris TaxID=1940612 RepID=A0A5C0B3I0_9BURK|nr:TonB-dependent receptor [Pigmentiphaga aceris]QEI07127.1 TonB-dependent receptor [Pigmentiphaga aceris]